MRIYMYLLIPLLCAVVSSCGTTSSMTPDALHDTSDKRGTVADKLSAALSDAEKTLASGLRTVEQRQAYAAQVGRVTALWLSLTKDQKAVLHVDETYRLETRIPAKLKFDELIPADSIKSRRLKERLTREGVGAAFVAHWKFTAARKAAEPFMSEAGYLVPVTATLDFSKASGGRRRATFSIHDPRESRTVLLAGRQQPLAADFTAYGEHLLGMKNVQMKGIKALLHSSEYMDKLGLLAFESPDKNRIPLVLVHGLMSRPATWENVINQFGADPEIQRHYQIYVFRYPSGVPVIFSSEKLREHLGTLQSILAREGAGMRGRNMVLIGHSMGGLVSKAQVQDSGDRIWVNILGDTPAALGLSKEEHEALRRYLEFDPNPNISRIIFAATPHRGSSMADGRLARIGRSLVKLPGQTFGSTFEVLESLASRDAYLSELLKRGMPTSVDNLSPGSPYVRIANSLPFRPGVRLHSIIGNKEGRPLTDPECSDGVVPYSSSHLDNVESELIVRSGHGVHEKPEAVEEMRRILRLHLKGLGLY